MNDRYDDEYDDEYYDDEYYDDDEYDDGGGRGFLLALVAVATVGLLAVIFVVILLYGGDDKDMVEQASSAAENEAPESSPSSSSGEAGPEAADPFGPMDSSAVEAVAADSEPSLEEGFDSPEPVPPVQDMEPKSWGEEENSWDEPEPSPPPRRAEPARRAPPTSQRASSQGSSGIRVSSGGGQRSSQASSRSSSSGSRAKSRPAESTTKSDADSEPRVVGGSSGKRSARGRATMEFTKEQVAALASRAGSGSLDDEQVRNLELIPDDHALFTQAWATLAKNAEAKKNYRGHCEASQKILTKPQNRYHPEWNLEMAKCQLRNKDYDSAVRSIDRTLGDPYGMASATKVQRLMTAYEIKARARTSLYDDHARSNSGLGDDNKLRAAVQAWTELRNYASGIGDAQAQRRADREIADLEARKGK